MTVKLIHPHVTFKLTTNSNPQGIVENYYKPLIAANKPVGVMTLNTTGPILELLDLAKTNPFYDLDQLYFHFKVTGQHPTQPERYIDVPDYSEQPSSAALGDWKTHSALWKKAFGERWDEVKQFCYFGVTNEPDREKTEWLAEYFWYMLSHAEAEGVKLAVMAWSAGTPDLDAWDGPWMARLLKALRESESALALHEYSLETDTLDVDFLVGRWRKRLDVLQDVKIIFPEFGWGERSAPPAKEAMRQLSMVYPYIYAFPNIVGLALWTTDTGWGNLSNIMIDMMPLVAEWSVVNQWAVTAPDPKPDPDPKPEPVLVSVNPVFDEMWDDLDGVRQVPKGWELRWHETKSPVSGERYVAPEVVHKGYSELPGYEAAQYIDKDSSYCLKIFDDNPFWCRLVQILNAEPGTYKVVVEGYLDAYRWEKPNRIYAVDPNQAKMYVQFDRDPYTASSYTPVKQVMDTNDGEPPKGPIGFYHEAWLHDWRGGPLQVAVHFTSEWAISNNWFIKKIAMYKMPEEAEEEPPVDNKPFIIPEIIAKAESIAPTNEDAAIQKAVTNDGLFLLGREEWMTQSNGKKVAVQPAHDGKGMKYAYYAEVGEWGDVRWVSMTDPDDDPDPGDYVMVEAVLETQLGDKSILGFGEKTVEQWGCLSKVYQGILNVYEMPNYIEWDEFHERMKAAGAYSGSNLIPSALEVAYPGMMDSIGWYPRGHASFESDIKTQIEQGLPVGIRVDLRPLTPQEEQHWVMVVGYRQDSNGKIVDYVVKDPLDRVPYPKWLSEDYDVEGDDALEMLRYRWVTQEQSQTIDLVNILFGSDDHPVLTMLHNGGPHAGHEEHIQYNYGEGILIKDGNYEEIWPSAQGIKRRIDTSPNSTEFYWVENPNGGDLVWLPRTMRIGEVWQKNERVQWSRKDTFNVTANYTYTNNLRLASYHPQYLLPDGTTTKVFVIEWVLATGQVEERYYYSPYGMVRWEKPGMNWYTEVVAIDWERELPVPADPPAVRKLKESKGW